MADDVVDLRAGDLVWYVKPGADAPLPAKLLSDGISESRTLAGGALVQYAHLAYGTADPGHELLGHADAAPGRQRQTFEATAPWDPTGKPGTWHCLDECAELTHPERAPEK